jgi:hypothetical protein
LTCYGHRVMIFGFLPQNVKMQAVAVAFSIAWLKAGVEPQPEDRASATASGAAGLAPETGCGVTALSRSS